MMWDSSGVRIFMSLFDLILGFLFPQVDFLYYNILDKNIVLNLLFLVPYCFYRNLEMVE